MLRNISLFCLAVLSATNCFAANPELKIEGRMDLIASYATESKKYRKLIPGDAASNLFVNRGGVYNDTKVDLVMSHKMTDDFEYGGMIRFNADTSKSTSGESSVGNKSKVYVKHNKIGMLEAGNTPGAAALFEMDTVNLAHGSWGVEGFAITTLTDRTARTSAVLSRPIITNGPTAASQIGGQLDTRSVEFVLSPNLPSNYSGKYFSDAPKINFFTKPMDALTLGLVYIPDMDSTGTTSGRAAKNGGPVDIDRSIYPATFKEIFGYGFMYEAPLYGDFGIKTGVAGEMGRAKLSHIKNLKAYEAGLMLRYKNFKIGSTYGDWFKSLTLKNAPASSKNRAKYYTVGMSQDFEKLGYSLTYINSKKAGGLGIFGKKIVDGFSSFGPFSPVAINDFVDFSYNKYQNLVLDIDYKLAPGFMPYATISGFKMKESLGSKDVGYVVLLGTRLTF